MTTQEINMGCYTIPVSRIKEPQKYFVVGQKVHYGNCNNCIITNVLFDGKAYDIEVDETNRDSDSIKRVPRRAFWFDLYDFNQVNKHDVAEFIERKDYTYRKSYYNIDLNSLMNMSVNRGFIMNKEYQRDYVWSLDDKTKLIESIYKGVSIGLVTFINMSYPNNTIEVVDGQQRITTILDFMQDMFRYRGKYWSEMTSRDRNYFTSTTISTSGVEECDMKKSDIYHMFLCCNTFGVMQDAEHLKMVGEKYKAAIKEGN